MKFNLYALDVARQRNRLTWNALADKLGISARELRRLRDDNTADTALIEKMASATSFPASFFTLSEDFDLSEPTFRKHATLSAKDRAAGEAAGKIAKVFWAHVEREYSLPAPDLPDYSSGEHYFPEGIDRATYAAQLLREEWGLGSAPIGNMIRLLERKGVRVLSLAEKDVRGLSGFTTWDGETPMIFLNMVASTERSRFDAAHELAHVVLHRNHDTTEQEIEEEADRFASAFLIPKIDLLRHKCFPTLANLRANKRRWKVSVAALVRAYRDNGLIDDGRYKYLNIELSRKGWRSKEPDQSPREPSGMWEVIKKDLWGKSETIEDLAMRAKIPVADAVTFTSFACGGLIKKTTLSTTPQAKGAGFLRLVK